MRLAVVLAMRRSIVAQAQSFGTLLALQTQLMKRFVVSGDLLLYSE